MLMLAGPWARAQIIRPPPPVPPPPLPPVEDPVLPPAAPLPTDLRLVPGTNATLQWTSTGPASWFVEYSSDFQSWTAPTNLGTQTPAGEFDTLVVTELGAATDGDPASRRFFRLTRPGQPVTITEQPRDNYARTNEPLFLSVSRTGDLPMIDRWFRDGTLLVTQTDASADWTFLNVTNSGAYQVITANPWGIVTSRVANLTFVDHLPPRIFQEPADATGFIGGFFYPPFEVPVPPKAAKPDQFEVTLGPTPSAVVEGDPPITFRWSQDNVRFFTETYTNLNRNGEAIYFTAPTNAPVSGAYQLMASNAWGMVTSRVATLNLSQLPATVAGGTLDLEVVYWNMPFSGPARFRLKPSATDDTCVMENVSNAPGSTGHYTYQANRGPLEIVDAELVYTANNRPPFRMVLTYNSPTNGVFQLIQQGNSILEYISAGKFTFTP